MRPDLLDRSIFELVNEHARHLEDKLKADVVFYHGDIHPGYFRFFRDFIEDVKRLSDRKNNALAVVLRTGGGLAETAERMVAVMRKHYNKVYFVVPDMAMSAGTILCMSGDKIYMDYASSLGPIDPQVHTADTSGLVPALGYLDKVEEITKKGRLAQADVVLLRTVDLAELALYEQARALTRDLLKKWLVTYKFKDWTTHRTTNPGTRVTEEQKQARAQEIATALGNHKKWRSHGRRLDIVKLSELKIEIDDYSDDANLRDTIRAYNDRLTGHIDRLGEPFFLHNHRLEP